MPHNSSIRQTAREAAQAIPDGDTINLLWERTNVPGPAAEGKTRGTYLSGTGKYTGIQGNYTFACRFAGALALCKVTGGEYKIP